MEIKLGGSFTYSDLEDVKESKQTNISGGFNYSSDKGAVDKNGTPIIDKDTGKQKIIMGQRSAQGGYTNSGSNEKGKTLATMGNGGIINKNSGENMLATSTVNKNINTTQTLESAITTGGANINVDVNLKNIVNAEENIKNASKNLLATAGNTVKPITVVAGAMSIDNKNGNFIDNIKLSYKIDQVQSQARLMGINQVDNAAEYATLLKENGLGDNTVMNYGNNTDGANGFYSQKDNLIGLNLLNSNGTTQSAKDVENTTWHEIAHANDSTNKNTQDRESFASSVGSAGSGMASVNNFFYGNGGLTDSSVAIYYNTNKNSSAMQQNNNIVSNISSQNRENDLYVATKTLGLNENASLEDILDRPWYSADHGSTVEISNSKEDIDNKMALAGKKPDDYVVSSAVDPQGNTKYFVIMSGGPENEGGIGTMLSNPGNLVVDFKQQKGFSKGDANAIKKYIETGNTTLLQKISDNKQDSVNAIKNLDYIHNSKLPYNPIPEIEFARPYSYYLNDLSKPSYNSNSTYSSVCKAAGGGSNCDLPGLQPGSSKSIDLPFKK